MPGTVTTLGVLLTLCLLSGAGWSAGEPGPDPGLDPGPDPRPDAGNTFVAHRVAHAGGSLGRLTRTNSYQALDANIKKGFSYFEIDFVFTSDNRLVCLHDWGPNFEHNFGHTTKAPLAYEAFLKLAAANERSTNCTLEGLIDWLQRNPRASIITDVRGDNLSAMGIIAAASPDARTRFIPQVYDPVNFAKVRKLGFKKIIWTLYRFSGIDMRVLTWVQSWTPPFAVTMPKDRALSILPNTLRTLNIPTYVHTVNSKSDVEKFVDGLGVTEIYTDFLAPDGPADPR